MEGGGGHPAWAGLRQLRSPPSPGHPFHAQQKDLIWDYCAWPARAPSRGEPPVPPATPQQRHSHGLSAGPRENRALERDPPSSDGEVTESVERVYCTLRGRSGRQGHPKSDVIHCIWHVTHQEKAGSPLPLETEPGWARGALLSMSSHCAEIG